MTLNELNKIYFLGIGGIGMSALARYFLSRGIEIFGYDKTETTLTKKLVSEGMTIHYTEDPSNIPNGIDLVIWTPAVPKEHKAFSFFLQNGIPVKKRAEVLGMISADHQTIAVAGTHGKTTTTSLVTHILHTGGIPCTAFLGGIALNFQSNYVEGNNDWVVVEADEYDRSFLHLSPEIAVLLSMDPDHLDVYGDLKMMHESGFKAFVQKTHINGSIYVKNSLAQFFENQLVEINGAKKLSNNKASFITYGLEEGTCRAENIRVLNGWFTFDFIAPGADVQKLEKLQLAMPGRHNVENATVAIAIALQLGVKPEDVRAALLSFKGIKRRFEFIFRGERITFIDDYAHHPTELKAAIQAARELFPGKKLTGIFQPHLYSRTRDFQDGFAEELDKLDEILLLDIYPAREQPIPGVSSEIIFEKMKNPAKEWVPKEQVIHLLKQKDIEVLMTLGAGDIDTIVEPIKEYLIQNQIERNSKP